MRDPASAPTSSKQRAHESKWTSSSRTCGGGSPCSIIATRRFSSGQITEFGGLPNIAGPRDHVDSLATMGAVTILVWGEVLWDRFPDGDRLGGAPANVAWHLGQLGEHV